MSYNITVIGTGYVGLITGLCLSEYNKVYCVDNDVSKIDKLSKGEPVIYEEGLEELLNRRLLNDSIEFTTNLKYAIGNSELCFIAVGTPTKNDNIDMQYYDRVIEELSNCIDKDYIVVDKSTVPVGTAIKSVELLNRNNIHNISVVSNPEFLKEGSAINDFYHPDRVVIGSEDDSKYLIKKIYLDFVEEGKILLTDTRSAEMIKYASNSYLATKISLINEIANITNVLGANIVDVVKGLSMDTRIGNKFISPGVGYGGSCFPKDVRALIKVSENNNYDPKILKSVEIFNNRQKLKLFDYFISNIYYNTEVYNIVIWGLSFKPNTDDTRESPAIYLINELSKLDNIESIKVYDPKATLSFESKTRVEQVDNKYTALQGASVLFIMTDWEEFKDPDLSIVRKYMTKPIILDGRNILIDKDLKDIIYYHI